MTAPKSILLSRVSANFEREPLVRPFGFKGGFQSEIWQSAALLESTSGQRGIGLCTQGVLWSDAHVFAGHSESGGNALMYAVTEWALQQLKGQTFTNPVELLEAIRHDVFAYAKKITGHAGLRETFALNALVGVDFAAWLLYARENGITNFDNLIPAAYRPALATKHAKVASIPLMAYGIPIDELKAAVDQGYFFMKIKIGQPGTQAEMLEKDKARISAIHAAIGHARTPYSASGKLPYYFDANGRYESKDTLMRLLEHTKAIGAFDQIALIEEPFPEELEIDISDIPARVAADESAHTDKDALARIQMGYKAIALKPIAKTFSLSLKIAQLAHERGVPCFCADLTVSPLLVEWNKNVAARLAPFPGLGLGLLETNGHQNYRNWETMRSCHPSPDAPWARTMRGVFELGADYYAQSGGIFQTSPHYEAMFAPTAK
ncbi:MAG: L-alanine-DL-glutamate epimerase [Opitutus sp.]|nr:L-alanine-DL-glutamate epimerase [Opitutus sp.]